MFNIFSGFQFIGWKFLYVKNNILGGLISRFTIKVHKANLKNLLRNFNKANVFLLIKRVNYIVIYWINNYSFSYSLWDVCGELDVYLNKLLWNFVKQQHSRKNNIWIYSKYWKYLKGKFYFYGLNFENGNICFLRSHYYIKSKVYRLPSSLDVFFIPDFFKLNILWVKKISITFIGLYKLLYINQYGICPYCGDFIYKISFTKMRILKFNFPIRLNSGKFSRLMLFHVICSDNLKYFI